MIRAFVRVAPVALGSCGFTAPWEAARTAPERDASAEVTEGTACPDRAPCVVEISLGYRHSCARTADGRVYCWGLNDEGQVRGANDGDDAGLVAGRPVWRTPTLVPAMDAGGASLRSATQIQAGADFTCSVLTLGTAVSCWGNDHSPTGAPGTIQGVVTRLTARGDHACARVEDGTAWCWGSNGDGALGQGITTSTPRGPEAVHDPRAPGAPLTGFADIAAGTYFTCGVLDGGAAWCWGRNDNGQLGADAGPLGRSPLPIPVTVLPPAVGPVRQLVTGLKHTCALLDGVERDGGAAGVVYCWGSDEYAQRGDGVPDASTGAVNPVSGDGGAALRGVTRLVTGNAHTCALVRGAGATPPEVYCWGSNSDGQCGQSAAQAVQESATRVLFPPGVVVESVALGGFHSCALTTDHRVYCWGQGVYGQLGNGGAGSTASMARPTLVVFP